MTLHPTSPYASYIPGADVPYHNSGIATPSNNPFLRAYCASPSEGVEEWDEISAAQARGRPALGLTYESQSTT